MPKLPDQYEPQSYKLAVHLPSRKIVYFLAPSFQNRIYYDTKSRNQYKKFTHFLFFMCIEYDLKVVPCLSETSCIRRRFTKDQSTVIKATVYMTYEKLRVTKFATYSQMITQLCNCCLAKNILVSVHVNL